MDGNCQADPWLELQQRVVDCRRCQRLVDHCRAVARARRRQFKDWDYWGRPVPGFGDPAARLLIVGLAPAAHGANRTGRMFTGDSSGDWLYRALHRYGFANQPQSASRDDGLRLTDVYVAAAARCAPPGNKPTPAELASCRPFLIEEYRLLRNVRVVLALGRIAFDTCLAVRPSLGLARPEPAPRFSHAAVSELPEGGYLISSYHPSRQNTQTGRLTLPMWNRVFAQVRRLLK